MPTRFAETRKFWACLIGAGATAALGIFPPHSIWWQIATVAAALGTAATVYKVSNDD